MMTPTQTSPVRIGTFLHRLLKPPWLTRAGFAFAEAKLCRSRQWHGALRIIRLGTIKSSGAGSVEGGHCRASTKKALVVIIFNLAVEFLKEA